MEPIEEKEQSPVPAFVFIFCQALILALMITHFLQDRERDQWLRIEQTWFWDLPAGKTLP
jgi:hypothetical protein